MGISSVLGTAAFVPAGYGFRNLIINGAMQVHQRGTSVASITTSGYRTADRWKTDITTLGTWTHSIENDAPTGSGFRKSFKMLCTTADASPSAGDLCAFEQLIEGQNLQSIKKGTSSAEQLTVSFWVKSNVTGTYIFELYDNDNTRQVSKSYTISASGTWEFKTLTLPADTTGAFDNDNALSLYVVWWLGAGSTFTGGTLNTSWASANNSNRVVGQTNVAAATNNYWQITGVQMEVGPVATAHEFRPINVELAQCQRYYHVVGTGDLHGSFYGGSASMLFTHLPTTMRVAPTATIPAGPYTNALLDYGIAFRTPSIVQTQSSTTNNYAIVAYNDITYTYIPTTWYGPNIQLSAEL
jgi:hypothetical protein